MHHFGSVANAPWMTDPAVTDVYLADAKYLGYPAVGGLIAAWGPAKGTHAPSAVANCTFGASYDAKGNTDAQVNNIPGSSYVAIDSLASGFNGNSLPCTLIVSAQIPVAPTGAPFWYLLAIANSSSNNSLIVFSGASGSTDISITRRNAGGIQKASSVFHPGTSRFVITMVNDGANLTTLFNGAVVDSGLAFGAGLMSGIDTFSIGVSRQLSGGGYSSPLLRALVYAPSALAPTSYQAITNALL